MTAKEIGVIGGGQLAWMMGQVADNLGLELIVQTPNYSDPAVSEAKDAVLGAIADGAITAKLADLCDVITFENEFIDLDALQSLVERGVIFRPSLTALAPLLDKYQQRTYLQSIGLPVPQFGLLEKEADIQKPLCQQFPMMLKARRHGYDGQGTFKINNTAQLKSTWEKYDRPSLLIEEFVPFAKELAIMVARDEKGNIVTYPVAETFQEEQVCRLVIAPANIPKTVAREATAIAKTLIAELQYVGILGIEFFLTADKRLLVNEIAPRTHNSGHYTLDACDISQFEMQLRAVASLPIINPTMKSKSALMVNLLGYETSTKDYSTKRQQIKEMPNTFVHWYGKTESRVGRKLGHVTVLHNSDQSSSLRKIATTIESLWYG